MIGFLETSFEKCCKSMALTGVYSLPLSHFTVILKVVLSLRQGCVLTLLRFIIYMNWMNKHNQTDECITIGRCNISQLLFAGDLVLLASESDFQRPILT